MEMAQLGVKTVINFREADTLEKRVALVKDVTNDGGRLRSSAPGTAGSAGYLRYIARGGLCDGLLWQ
ncbi:MAG: hypothetical protein ACLSS9_14455 [Acutalibacteraceae bacterium]